MAAFTFPNSPNLGDTANGYTWDGEKWLLTSSTTTPPAPASATPLVESGSGAVGTAVKYAREDHVHPIGGGGAASSANPLMNGVAAPGTATPYSREDHIHPVDTSRAPLASPAFTGTPTTATTPTAGDNTTKLATTAFVATAVGGVSGGTGAVRYDIAQGLTAAQQAQAQGNIGLPAIMRSYLAGLTLSTAGGSPFFGIAAGVAADSTNVNMMSLPAAITKNYNSWGAGTGVGALDTGAIAVSAWYHAYLIARPDTGAIDVCVSLSATAPTLGAFIPAAYTLSRRIGSMKTDAGANWTKFFQVGDEFMWDTTKVDIIVSNPGTAAVARSLSVPPGVRVLAIISGSPVPTTASAFDGRVNISSLDVADEAVSQANLNVGSYNVAGAAMPFMLRVMTNTASQIRTKHAASDAGTTLNIGTRGWVDRRGRDN